MVCSDAGSLGIVKNWGCTCLINNIIPGILKIRFFLLPEKEDVKV
jgi:hypothetical protein